MFPQSATLVGLPRLQRKSQEVHDKVRPTKQSCDATPVFDRRRKRLRMSCEGKTEEEEEKDEEEVNASKTR